MLKISDSMNKKNDGYYAGTRKVCNLLSELKCNNLIVGEDEMEYFIKEDMY